MGKNEKKREISDACPFKHNGYTAMLCGFCPNYCEKTKKKEIEEKHN